MEFNTLVKVLLRTYGGIFDYNTKINLNLVVKKTDLEENVVISQLKQLEKDNMILLELANSDSEITFLKPREDDITINPIAKIIEQQNQIKKDQIEAVISYTENVEICKSIQLLRYFGEKSEEPCGTCSVCLSVKSIKENKRIDLKSDILSKLENGNLSSRQLHMQIECSQEELIKHISELIELGLISITERNTYQLK